MDNYSFNLEYLKEWSEKMKKQFYNIYMECIKESPAITAKVGEVENIGKIKSEGLTYSACKAIQETVGEYFKVYYK